MLRGNSERISHVLGNYEIFEELGRGGMGIVYRGLDLSLDRPVAVKVLRDDLRMQSMIVSRFAREARAAAALDHPNIVQIYTVGEADRTPYIAMEFVDSEPLSAIMIRDGVVPWRRAFAIGSQVAAALASAHDAQIIHRDVKPPNILMTSKDKAYVTDFGIAKILSMHDQLTLDGTKLGTPQYMSPERCKTGDASASSDLYSLGVLLFQMISGRLPHEGASAPELVKRILSQPPARLRAFVPDVPDDVERMIAWLIEARPECRPASAMEARDALERVLAGQRLDINDSPVSRAIAEFRGDASSKARKISRRTASAKRTRRKRAAWNPWLTAGVGAAAALALGWGAGALIDPRPHATALRTQEISNWYASKSAATLLREAENVWIAHLADPGLQIGNVAWSDAAQTFILCTSEEGDGAVRRALLAVQPSTWEVRAVTTRLSATSSGIFMLDVHNGAHAAFVGSGSNIAVAPSGLTAADIHEALATAVGEARVADVVKIAFNSSVPRFLFVLREPDGGETVYEQAVGERGVPHTTGSAIETAGYASGGSYYYYSDRDARGMLRVYSGDGYGSPTLSWQGVADLAPGGIHPDGSRMIVTGDADVLKDISLSDPTVENVLGAGTGAVWADAERVVALAADTRGVLQLWEVSIKSSETRRQLTFIEGGVRGPVVVSGDGSWVAARPNAKDQTAVLLLRLPGVPAQSL